MFEPTKKPVLPKFSPTSSPLVLHALAPIQTQRGGEGRPCAEGIAHGSARSAHTLPASCTSSEDTRLGRRSPPADRPVRSHGPVQHATGGRRPHRITKPPTLSGRQRPARFTHATAAPLTRCLARHRSVSKRSGAVNRTTGRNAAWLKGAKQRSYPTWVSKIPVTPRPPTASILRAPSPSCPRDDPNSLEPAFPCTNAPSARAAETRHRSRPSKAHTPAEQHTPTAPPRPAPVIDTPARRT